MITKLYSIHDRVANIYEPPISSQNDATVMRWFARCVDHVPTMKSSPGDFALYEVGTFDSSSGLIDTRESLLFVCTALDCINNIHKGADDEISETKVGDDSPVQSGS